MKTVIVKYCHLAKKNRITSKNLDMFKRCLTLNTYRTFLLPIKELAYMKYAFLHFKSNYNITSILYLLTRWAIRCFLSLAVKLPGFTTSWLLFAPLVVPVSCMPVCFWHSTICSWEPHRFRSYLLQVNQVKRYFQSCNINKPSSSGGVEGRGLFKSPSSNSWGSFLFTYSMEHQYVLVSNACSHDMK